MTHAVVDVFRVLVLSLAGLTIGLAAYIAVAYMRTYVELTHSRRFAPFHVAGFALSHLMYTIHGAATVLDRLGEPLTWNLPYLVVANMLSGAVLVLAARKERRRMLDARRADALGYPLRRRDDLPPPVD